MFARSLPVEFAAWIAALATPLHARLRQKLPVVIAGILFASGRRTISSWWRAAQVGSDFRSYYYFLDSLGRKIKQVAGVLLKIVCDRVLTGDRLVFAIDDSPTKRYGPKVQGAGIHHNPTPGPAGAKFLYGHSWVVLSRLVRHNSFGLIGLLFLGLLYVRKKNIDNIPKSACIAFQTKIDQASEMVCLLRCVLPGKPIWLVVDGAYAKRGLLTRVRKQNVVIVSRLRSDAALFSLPPEVKPGKKRGRGRPPTYGKNRICLAKRAGQRRGWTTIEVKTNTGSIVTKRIKTFLATGHSAGGAIQVVLVEEEDGSWRALLCTDLTASALEIVQMAMDRWGIEKPHAQCPSRRWLSPAA